MADQDFGINDLNLQQLLGGINNPAALASLLSQDGAASFLPLIRRRQMEATKSYVDSTGENNIARALLHQQAEANKRRKNDQEFEGKLISEAPNLAREGINSVEAFKAYGPITNPGGRGSLGVAALLGQDAKRSYAQNQRAEALGRAATNGYPADEGTEVDLNASQLPILRRDGSRATGVLEALARANANNGKTVAQYGPDDALIGSSVTMPPGVAPPKNLMQPGQERDLAVPPAAEQEMRKVPQLSNAQFAKLPGGKGYVAKYKSGGKDVTVIVPADANGRPLKEQARVINGTAAP